MPNPRSKPPFRWNAALGRYIRADGKFVAWADVRAALDKVLDGYSRDVRGWNAALRSGTLTLVDWRENMRNMIRATHLFAQALAKGGWASMTPSDYGTAGRAIRDEFAFLDRMATRISNGILPLDGNFQQWSRMYAQAARETFHEAERNMRQSVGYRFERNLRFAGDSCAGCIAASARGWVRIGTLPPIGARDCLRNCRCSLAYSRSEPGD